MMLGLYPVGFDRLQELEEYRKQYNAWGGITGSYSGGIDYGFRESAEFSSQELLVPKSYCPWCHQVSCDDYVGACAACGAPRK